MSLSSDTERINRLQLAGDFCMFDNKLRSSGNGSIAWGVINTLIGGSLLASGHIWAAVSLIFGLALVVEGIYERRVRDPKVIIVSAATLASLALLHFTFLILAALGKEGIGFGGRTLYWAIAEAAGAFATWKTYATYKMLRAESDPLIVEQLKGYIAELRKTKPGQSLDLIEFDRNAGFLKPTERYRLKPMEDLYLVGRYQMQFRSMKLEAVGFVRRNEVTLSAEGEKWMSKKIKATIQLGAQKLEKIMITPDMAARIGPLTSMMALPIT
jgi:uncharacterized protein YjeT (DUF2065 family)